MSKTTPRGGPPTLSASCSLLLSSATPWLARDRLVHPESPGNGLKFLLTGLDLLGDFVEKETLGDNGSSMGFYPLHTPSSFLLQHGGGSLTTTVSN